MPHRSSSRSSRTVMRLPSKSELEKREMAWTAWWGKSESEEREEGERGVISVNVNEINQIETVGLKPVGLPGEGCPTSPPGGLPL